MVTTATVEEARSKSVEDRLFKSAAAAEVGLLIGKLSADSSRGFIYDLIPTPPTDAGGPACSLKQEGAAGDRKKGSKGGKVSAEAQASLVIDGDWVAEHARQVSRMLLGGMEVVGVYLWASEAAFKSTSPALLAQAVRGVAEAAPWSNNGCNERLLLHVSYSPRRWACRVCTLKSGSLRPCEFKTGKLLASLQAFRCFYNFELRLPVLQAGPLSSKTFKFLVHEGISHIDKELQNANALIDGKLVSDELQNSSTTDHEIELLLPFKNDASTVCRSEEVAGLVVFSGSVCAYAYLAPKEPASQAISDLKGDIINSLRSRLDIITDEMEGDVALASNDEPEPSSVKSTQLVHEQRKLCSLSFPRRVLIPWLAGIFICDYVQASETLKDTQDRCRELISMDTPIENTGVLEPETEPKSAQARSFWDVALSSSSKSRESLARKEGNAGELRKHMNFVAAFMVILIAFLAGWAVKAFALSS